MTTEQRIAELNAIAERVQGIQGIHYTGPLVRELTLNQFRELVNALTGLKVEASYKQYQAYGTVAGMFCLITSQWGSRTEPSVEYELQQLLTP